MAKIGNATIKVGDLLRLDADDREGTVSAINGEDVTLVVQAAFNTPEKVTVPASKCYYNLWDKKFELSGKQPPVRQPSVMTGESSSLDAYQAKAKQEATQAAAAVDKARAAAAALVTGT